MQGQITWQGSLTLGPDIEAQSLTLNDPTSGDEVAVIGNDDGPTAGGSLELCRADTSDVTVALYALGSAIGTGIDGQLYCHGELTIQATNGDLELKAMVTDVNVTGKTNVGIVATDGDINITPSATAAKRTVITKPNIVTFTPAAAGDVGMNADGRPMTFAASGFDERGIGIAAASRRVAAAKDVCDYLYDSGPKTISTSSLTVIATIAGPASGKMYGIDAQLIGKFQDESNGEHLVRRIIAINNAGTITVTQGTNSGVSGTLGDAFGVQVNGANLEFYIDPGDATARDYRYIARVWELV